MTSFFIILAVIVADQLSKFFVRLLMDVGDSVRVIPGVLNFTHVENDGAAFGILDDARWVFVVVSCIGIIGMLWFLRKFGKRHTLLAVSLSFIVGGGIGNMIDRLFVTDANGVHVVTDFIEAAFVDFAVFNIADSFITIGAVLLGVYVLFYEPKVEKRIAAERAAAEASEQDTVSPPDTDEADEKEENKEKETNEENSSDNR